MPEADGSNSTRTVHVLVLVEDRAALAVVGVIGEPREVGSRRRPRRLTALRVTGAARGLVIVDVKIALGPASTSRSPKSRPPGSEASVGSSRSAKPWLL